MTTVATPRGHIDDEALAASFRPAIYGQAMRLLQHADDCEDATQEVLLKVVRFLPRFEHRSKLSTWIYRITYNVCMNMVEQRRRFWQELADGVVDPADVDDTSLEEQETRALVLGALQRLPEKYRVPLFLYYYHELSYHEIARTLRRPVNTVKVHVHRAKRLLRYHLSTSPQEAAGAGLRLASGGEP